MHHFLQLTAPLIRSSEAEAEPTLSFFLQLIAAAALNTLMKCKYVDSVLGCIKNGQRQSETKDDLMQKEGIGSGKELGHY